MDVIVVGAGLAGLRCALELERRGLDVTVLEASDAPGGRVRTDEVDGFRLDRGFQVYLTGYEEAGRVLDLRSLDLGQFDAGALIRYGGAFRPLADPIRHPVRAIRMLVSGPGRTRDLMRLGLRRLSAPVRDPWRRSAGGQTTLGALEEEGYTKAVIDQFFRPFFGGVFLDPRLDTSAAMFDFVLSSFSRGRAALPRGGMEAIPRQLASRLRGRIRTGARAVAVEPGRVTLVGGAIVEGRAVVVATPLPEARWLTGINDDRDTRSTRAFYFAAEAAPVRRPVLVLNGDGEGPVNHVCFPSEIAEGYAPPGQTLVSATVLETSSADHLEDRVRDQLASWFGPVAQGWRLLRSYTVQHALPAQPPGSLDGPRSPVLAPGLFMAGDHRTHASIEGALVSGRHTAEAVSQALAA
ncbi:MAG: NAD(P)/FAD-dependent oxidoreductase [Gemmatimonadota bacterium]